MKPIILIKHDAPHIVDELSRDFDVLEFDLAAGKPDAVALKEARVLITSGFRGAFPDELAALPNLGLICTVGTGYEKVDLAAARARGIAVVHAAGINAGVVADHAFALLLACLRNIPAYHASAAAGRWREGLSPRPMAAGKKLGLIGMGGIGKAIARRAEAFDMPVSYMARSRKDGLPWTYFTDAEALAREVDILIAAVPGGPETFHMIDRRVLRALGPQGFVINVGRGTVVATDDLVAALNAGEIAGAGIDVFETEPDIPPALRTAANIVLTPHVAGTAPETRRIGAALMRRNIEAFLAGRPLETPVPEMAGG